MITSTAIEQKSINTIRTLSIDAIEKANSGHPGLPMGAAPMAYTLWTDIMNHNPGNSKWFNRDRFVLSAGHGSMLLYSLLHLSGYDVSMDDIKAFRQWDSKTPGHPEVHHTDGVEATTGPLGQGFAMSVGMAMAESHLAARFNQPGMAIVDHYTYSLVGDGDIMEGISHEAASLAGHLGLGKLIVLYDSNDISLDGDLDRSFSDNTARRFEAYGWQVLHVEDGNDIDAVKRSLEEAKAETERPTLIEVKTVIGFGSPNKSASSSSHGAPLGKDEVRLTKENYGWEHEPFHVPEEVYKDFRNKVAVEGSKSEEKWNDLFESYKQNHPELAAEFEQAVKDELPAGWDAEMPVYDEESPAIATRAASGKMLNAISGKVPHFMGGSADLAGSNKTNIDDEADFTKESYGGRNIWFGVREFAMAAALNGMALHGGLKVYGGTFFVFSDYLRPAVRLSSIMNMPVTYVFTHDSIAVGEDGPTHEPVEQLASLRAMPGLSVIRPADANETHAAWKLALESTDTPTALVLTRQNLPVLSKGGESVYDNVRKGGYIIQKGDKDVPDALLIATGSEVQLAMKAHKALKEKGIDTNVISLPSWDRFSEQDIDYRHTVIPPHVKARIGIEMGATLGWGRFVGDYGVTIGIDKFGASANGDKVIEEYGFTVENVVEQTEELIKNTQSN